MAVQGEGLGTFRLTEQGAERVGREKRITMLRKQKDET